MQAEADPFADLALTAKDRARRSLLLEYESRFQSRVVSATPSPTTLTLAPAAAAHASPSHVVVDDDDGFDPYHHASSGDDDDDNADLARQVASLHAEIDHHLLLRRQVAVAEPTTRPRASTLGLDHHLPRLRRTDRPVSCPPLASNPFSSLSSALALSATAAARTRSAPTSSFPSPSLSNASLRSPSALAHAGDEWRPPLPNQWSANVLDDLDFLDTSALPAAASTPDPCSPATEAEDPLIRLARDTGPPSPTLSVMSSLAFELAGALGHDPPLIDTSAPTSPTALAFDVEDDCNDNHGVDPRTVPLVAHRTVLDSDTVVTTYAYPQHTNAKRASYMSTTASAAAIARSSVLSSSPSTPGSRRTSAAAGHVRADRRPSSMFSSASRHSAAGAGRRSAAHSVRGSVFIDTDADVIVSTSTSSASIRGSFMEMRANMEMDMHTDDASVLAYGSPTGGASDDEGDDEDEDVLGGSVQALTRWSHRFSVPPNPFVDPDEDPLTNPAAWTQGEAVTADEEQGQEHEERRRTNASLDALAAIRDNEDVHQGTSHAMLRLMGIRDPPPVAADAAAAADGYDPDDPHAAILDPSDLGLAGLGGLGASLADDLGGGLSLEEELADAELKRFSTMLDRVASQIEDLRVADTKLTASLEKVCARCRMIQTAGPGVREYLDPCEVHGMPDDVGQAPSR